ncbi:hypothetical protein [Clostridium perfringens]|uniref:Uncharacterized protein n=2 Tax=Clostridium perfringens TaxID=1502 RepID=A0AAN5ND67_CLOPF|nr:hypothetical protein [Clostridium perfringens]AQW26251.1 hypothetical protein BXT94_05505 [Clostridium perfringens]KQC93178.1 hypothetical protein AM596_05100 [Clostridium perfringens CP4]MBO3337242.1 hypothetical protein [Clostridium perfringens]MBO3384586.1 hypothetical protein [Clostridium perfringens]MBO3397002.1 hypothetical protein [Clostridium perfringens]
MTSEYLTNFISIFGAFTGGISLYFTYKNNKRLERPKIKVNLNKLKGKEELNHYNLLIENISDYNLYDFSITLDEIDLLDNELVKEQAFLLKTTIPVFTIGQIYTTYLFNATDCKDSFENLNFNIQYRIKPNGNFIKRKLIKEKYTININALRNITLKFQ